MHFCRSESKSSSSFCPYKSCPDQGNNIPQCNLNFHRKRALRSLFNGHVSPHGGAASAIFGLYEVSCLTLSCLLLNAAKKLGHSSHPSNYPQHPWSSRSLLNRPVVLLFSWSPDVQNPSQSIVILAALLCSENLHSWSSLIRFFYCPFYTVIQTSWRFSRFL